MYIDNAPRDHYSSIFEKHRMDQKLVDLYSQGSLLHYPGQNQNIFHHKANSMGVQKQHMQCAVQSPIEARS